ncbi:MAG: hypothetical protein AAB038_01515 [Planctomycetota bacterium]
MPRKKSSDILPWALIASAIGNIYQVDKQAQTKQELELTRNFLMARLREWQKKYTQIKEEKDALRKMLDDLETELFRYKNEIWKLKDELNKAKVTK